MDGNLKAKYLKSRYIVKKWESEFKVSKGSAPTKLDIKAASKRVRDAYSTYWKLKAELLETSLIDATLDDNAKDCFTAAPKVLSQEKAEEDVSKLDKEEESCSIADSTPPVSFKSLLSSAEKKSPLKDNNDANKPAVVDIEKETSEIGKSVWGPHLSVKQEVSCSNRSLKERSVSFHYTEKLFANAKFSKRNPRKSLRRNKTCDSLPTSDSCSAPAIAPHQDCASVTHPPADLILLHPPPSSPLPPLSPLTDFVESGSGHFDLLSEVKRVVIKEAPKVSYQGTGAVQSLLLRGSGKQQDKVGPTNSRLNRTVDIGWLGRVDSDSGIASSSAPLNGINTSVPDDDDELICSDDESKSRFAVTVSNHGVRKQDVGNSRHEEGSVLREGHTSSASSAVLSKALTMSLSDGKASSVFSTPLIPRAEESSTHVLPVNKVRGVLDLLYKGVKPSLRKETELKGNDVSNEVNLGLTNQILDEKTKSSVEKKDIFPLTNVSTKVSEEAGRSKRGRIPDASTSSHPNKKTKIETAAKASAKSAAAKKQKNLEKNVLSGAANINFRRIDIQKKIFTRGKKNMNFSNYKKKQWKKLNALDNSGVVKCFKCGDVGHMARQCKGVSDLLPYEEFEEGTEESLFPSLEDAAEAAAKQAVGMRVRRIPALIPQTPSEPPPATTLPLQEEEVVNMVQMPEPDSGRTAVEPLYSLNPDDSLPMDKEEVYDVLRELGYQSFLPGQEEAIMSVLCGRSCLVILPTGSGKSLVYRLPALLYHRRRAGSIALVVSPLVSLMEDQVSTSGEMMSSVGCIHHCQSDKQKKDIESRLGEGQLSVLLVSPEMLTRDSALSLVSKLPPVSFACIDEAHCLSHWSHNFRPSYLSLCQMLRQRLGVKTLLGLTASVTASTVDSVVSVLGGGQDEKIHLVKSKKFLPSNLVLSASQDEDRESALISLLTGSRFSSCDSLIVYCTRREECVRIAALLRTNLPSKSTGSAKGRQTLSLVAEVYHAGLTPGRRKQVQKAFMSGKVRIVVATVAFGMGINKKDLRGVIHFNMPSTFENYLQEVGRAGRDGLPAHCHLFLSPSKSRDVCELKRHIYANSVDRCTLRRLIELARPDCNGCSRGKHEVAFPADEAVQELDLSQEVISTLVSYLTSAPELGFSLLTPAYIKARVASYKGAANLASHAKQCGVLGAGIAMARRGGKVKVTNSVEFDVIKLADSLGWDSGIVKKTLKNLEWLRSEEEGTWSKSGVNVVFDELGVRLVAPCGLSPELQDSALDLLHSRVTSHVDTALKQLHYLYNSLQAVAYKSVKNCSDDIDLVRCEKLSSSIEFYFTSKTALDDICIQARPIEGESEVESSVRSLVSSGGDTKEWTGRAIARILHGISSPRYPALIWASTPFWRRHLDQDFPSLLTFASLTLRRCR